MAGDTGIRARRRAWSRPPARGGRRAPSGTRAAGRGGARGAAARRSPPAALGPLGSLGPLVPPPSLLSLVSLVPLVALAPLAPWRAARAAPDPALAGATLTPPAYPAPASSPAGPATDVAGTANAADAARTGAGTGEAPDRAVAEVAGGQELGALDALRQALASPELAYLLLALGALALVYEVASPGVGVAGAAGLVLLALGFVGLSALPFRAPGLLLLLLATVLFVAEVLVWGVGVFAAGGTVALLCAGALLFRGGESVSGGVLWPVALAVGAGALAAGRLAARVRKRPPSTGWHTLLGREAEVRGTEGAADGGARVRLEGAWWSVRGRDGPVSEGQRVRVVAHEGLALVVVQAGPPGDRHTEEGSP